MPQTYLKIKINLSQTFQYWVPSFLSQFSLHDYVFAHTHKTPVAVTLPLIWCNFLVFLNNAAHQKNLIPPVATKAVLASICKALIFPPNFSNAASTKGIPSSFYRLANSCNNSKKKKKENSTLKIQAFHLFEPKP